MNYNRSNRSNDFNVVLMFSMPRTYTRKTNYQNWAAEGMAAALADVEKGTPYKKAARALRIQVIALKIRPKCTNKSDTGCEKVLSSRQPLFTIDQERDLVAQLYQMETRMYELTIKDVLGLTFELAEQSGLEDSFSKEKRKAGYEWLRGIRIHNQDITLCAPDVTSTVRTNPFNKPMESKN
ncbi:hypothetical protein FQA39_LY04540 [Lamprigera yunnana]|nr:hypothetical protein FQA39_LY04540 [Lamprigera yunnana]